LKDKYIAYEDDKQFFPPYNISLGIRNKTAQTIGQDTIDTLVAVQGGMTDEAMAELNRRVELDKQQFKAVAAAYLKEEGFVE
jgi:glycine betaine/choline ABC-type transport system substrate-binding protein